MRKERKLSKKRLVMILSLTVAVILGIQLVAATAWTADAATSGPAIVILQMSDDPDSTWAVQDLQRRLNGFVVDDPFIQDRIRVIHTDDPFVAMELQDSIIIYVSHGGPLGIVTGSRLTSWKTMASIVEESGGILHLFTACYSRNIIRYGSEESGKKLYTVPSARPAEVTNVEIAATVMLALGVDTEYVEDYRTLELTKAKQTCEIGTKVHIMDFEQIILDEIETIDETYDDTYTSDHKVYRVSEEYFYSTLSGLPTDLTALLSEFFGYYHDGDGVPTPRLLQEIHIYYTMNYYIESNYVLDPEDPEDPPIDDPDPIDPEEPIPRPDPGDPGEPIDRNLLSMTYIKTMAYTPGHWVNETPVFTGGSYVGYFRYQGDPYSIWPVIYVNVTASGSTEYNVDNIHLEQYDVGGVRVEKVKVDGVWQDPVGDRVPGRTGGLWIDPAAAVNYEYDACWPISGSAALADWQYRKLHRLGGAGSSGTNYQVRITVHYGAGTDSGEHVYLNSHCQTDFDDIRFTTSDGSTLLDYWRQSYVSSYAAIFWVEVKDDLDYDTTIYLYYGNPTVSTTSNGASTFIQFDDFNDGTLASFWATAPGTGTISETGGNLKLSVAAGVNGDWWGGSTEYAPLVYSNAPTSRYEAVVRLNSYTVNLNTHAGIMIYQNRNNAYTCGRYRSSSMNNYNVEKIINDVGYGGQGSYSSTAMGTLLRAKYLGGTYYFELSLDDGYTWHRLKSESELRPPYIGLFAKEWGSYSLDAVFDYWYVRKSNYDPEPSHDGWGGEEYVSMTSWAYRKTHTIQGSSGAGTDYQIRITAHYGAGTDSGEHVYLNSHSQTDFDDLRFTDATGTVLLDYWMESYSASNQAVFWVEVKDSLDTASNVYIYYGNPSVGSASNGAATFLQFDDFNDNSVSGSWTQSKPVGAITEQWGSSLVMSIGSTVNGDWWGGTTEYAPIIYRAAPSTNYAAVTKLSTYTVNDNTHAGIMAYNNRDNAYLHGRYRSSSYNYYRIEKIISNTGYGNIASYSSTTMNTELRIREIGSYKYYDISFNGGSSWTNMLYTTELNPTYLGLFTKEFGSSTIDSIFDFWYVRKCIGSEPAHGAWGNEERYIGTGQGNLEQVSADTGDYLRVTGIPSGVEWNGPSFLQTLPSIFKLDDFGSFSTNISLLHGGTNARMTQTSVCLYDTQKHPVFKLMVRDGSAYSSSQTLRVYYYDSQGTENMYESALLPGDFKGIISLRYDPLNGLSCRFPDEYEHILITHNHMDDYLGRPIKYVGIESERYGTWTEHDERIYSIRVSYSGSDYTVFHEDCSDAAFLHQDNAFATTFLKEDAEDGDTALWQVYDDDPPGTITNDLIDGDMAIHLLGGGWNTCYRYPSTGNDWNAVGMSVIQWSVKYSEYFTVYISVDTNAGHRYLMYTCDSSDGLGSGEYIHFGLSSTAYDGNWHTFQRDLQADLARAQPSVTINDVNAFLIRGSGYVDDIKLLTYLQTKEDAEDGRTEGWGVYSGSGNTYNSLVDSRRVIQLSGSGTSTGYKYPYSESWNDAKHLTIQWSMKYYENYRIYISIDTSAGHRYMTYDPVDYDNLGTGEYVYHGLGSDSYDGTWRTFTRDLLADLHEAQPSADIIDVNAFLIRGSGYIDDIKLLPHSSEAELVVPSGQSYIQPSIISRPSTNAWHGGTFVNALDRPFRLYQLSEFSMHGIVDQVSSDRMGNTYVGLFDEHMKCVFWIYMGDAWGGVTKGYFNTAYYPEDGGSYYQASGDLTTDFDKTGCLWYDRGTNSIMSTMTGKDVVTLAEVDNPERVIMYLVVTVQRYDHYDLLDMRIHDINLRVNVRTAPPDQQEPPPSEDPLPVKYDGTTLGPKDAPDVEGGVNTGTIMAASLYIITWILEMGWPILVIKLLGESSHVIVELGLSLLSFISVRQCAILSFLENLMGGLFSISSILNVFLATLVIPRISILWWLALYAWHAFDTLRNSGVGLAASAGAFLGASALTMGFLCAWHSYVVGVKAVAGTAEAAELYAGMFIFLIQAIFFKNQYINADIADMGIQLALLAANFVAPNFMNNMLEWNPVFGIGTIVFKFVTLAFVTYWMIRYTLEVMQGWWSGE